MIVQQKRCWNLNIYLRTLFCFIFHWSVYPLISSTKSGPQPELEQISHLTISGNISLCQIYQKGGAKIAACKFCGKTFSASCTTRATASILGRPALGQTKAGMELCVLNWLTINKKDDDQREILKNAQLALSKVILEKEEAPASKVMDKILTPSPIKSAELSMKDSQNQDPKKWMQRQHLIFMKMALLSIQLSNCFLFLMWAKLVNHWHILTKILNKLSPETIWRQLCQRAQDVCLG